MAFSLIPDGVYPSIYDLDLEALSASGVRLLLVDLDNTISPYSVLEPTDQVRDWVSRLKEHGISLFILSNNRSQDRARRYCTMLGVPFIGHAGKPRRASFMKAMEQMNASPRETVMVGDQIFTDVLGGKRAGLKVFLVSPIELRDSFFRRLRHALERPLISMGKGRQRRAAQGKHQEVQGEAPEPLEEEIT